MAIFLQIPSGRPSKNKKTDACFVYQKNKTNKCDTPGSSNFRGLIIKCNRSATEMKELTKDAMKFYDIPYGKKCCSRCRSLLRTHMIKTSSNKEIANETEEYVVENLNSTG